MFSDFGIIINPLDHIYSFLNQPVIKESVKEMFGLVTFIFGIREVLHLAENGFQKTSTIILISKFSLILSASVTRPSIFIASSVIHLIATPEQLDSFFGPYTIFLSNPWHPRHIISFIALLLALPLTFQTLYDILFHKDLEEENKSLRFKTLFNTFASRPILHIGNRLSSYLIRG